MATWTLAEYFAKMEFTRHGLDVYTAEVDDKGIDFIIRNSNKKYFEIQVKSVREKTGYVFKQKDKFDISNDNLFLLLVLFIENQEPKLFLIKADEWKSENDYEYDESRQWLDWAIYDETKYPDIVEKEIILLFPMKKVKN